MLGRPDTVRFLIQNNWIVITADGGLALNRTVNSLDYLLIRPKRFASTRNCHPERSVAESKDLRLPFVESVQLLKGRIKRRMPTMTTP